MLNGWTPLGPPHDREGRFVNWSRTVTSRPLVWHEPASEDEIATIVGDASAANQRVHVVGAGHSWSAVAAPDHIGVSLDRFSGVTGQAQAAVTARAGTRLCDLNGDLARRGLALPILGSITRQSIAGAIATGTHGSSLVHGNLASLVEGVRLVTGGGEVLDLDADDVRLDGARVHLGALGAITHVTLRVVPEFRLAQVIESVPVGEVASELEAIGAGAEFVKVWWLPHTPLAYVYRYERTDEPPSRRPTPEAERWFEERIMHGVVLPLAFAAHRLRPATIPAWNRAMMRTFLEKPRRVGSSEAMLTTPMPVRHRETEAVVPLTSAGEAFDRMVRLIDTEAVRVNLIVELRFVRGDSAWLSPAQGGDVVQIGAYAGETPEVGRYFAAFWREMRQLGARPHWGKEMDHAADEVRALWPLATRFGELRDELDPARVFANPFLDRVLGA
jgi:L-gulono-1,4-lactone dehydrogenase